MSSRGGSSDFLGQTIVIDSREQRPYDFGPDVLTVTRKLDSGDYSLEGHESSIAIERKELSDLRGCIGHGRGRFTRELERLQAYDYACIVVEATLAELRQPARVHAPGRRQLSPNSVVGSLTAWAIRHQVGIWFAGSRPGGRELTYRLLRNFWRQQGDPDHADTSNAQKTAATASASRVA